VYNPKNPVKILILWRNILMSNSKKIVKTFLVLLLLNQSIFYIKAQELKAEEIISRHLDSIGTKEKRDEIKNRLAAGTSEFESKLPSRKTGGKAIFVSDANNLFFVSSFNSQEYPFEKIGFFNGKANLPFVSSGTRSPLGAFIADHNKILSDGLLTGSISGTWTLLKLDDQKAMFKSAGTKKVDGRETYVMSYFSKGVGSSEFTVKLFFDSQNFRHVRTEYRRTVSPKEDTFGVLGRQGGLKISLIEDFGDFKNAGSLTLPHTYKIHYTTDSNSGTYEYIWGFKVSQYLFNQKLDPNFFTFDEK
jgi:hypothetical protein